MADEDWNRMIAVHLSGTFYCIREALKKMVPREAGSIINISSIMGLAGGAVLPHYSAAKAGVLGLTRSLALELASLNIRVNAIAPGWVETHLTRGLAPLRTLIEAKTPLGRYGDLEDVSWAAVYLASDESKFVTGEVLSPNGGWHMGQ